MYIYKHYHDEEEARLLSEIRDYLGIPLDSFALYHVYHLEDPALGPELMEALVDLRGGELVAELPAHALYVRDKDGQYNQREDMANEYLQHVRGVDTRVKLGRAYVCAGASDEEWAVIQGYLINPVVQEIYDPTTVSFHLEVSDDSELQPVEGFNSFSEEELQRFKETRGVGLDLDDLQVVQEHFTREGRDPRFCEIKMLDTYWSDHCRHTTFLTALEDVEIADGRYAEQIRKSYASYLETRAAAYEGREAKPVSLMDLATINARDLKKQGLLTDVEETDEVNACSIEVDIEVGGKQETWLHMFKNETHNHPTEIEPYGGAHTCIGGCIRDPLSGRSEIIQGIRITGAGNPLTPYTETLEGKLSQRYLATTARDGFSDYANQIGAPVGLVREYYDDGFQAKRMELGALVAAVPKDQVTRAGAEPGDVVLLLGAPTGRDGLGAAVGSSAVQTEQTLKKAGAEVQKGNPFAERRMMRLFKRPEAKKLIKVCNDFGAGGVSVAIGELAEGLAIDLNQVHTKYPGMNGYEIALSESQERMAVVVDAGSVEDFRLYCAEEDVTCQQVAVVTDDRRLTMRWNGEVIMDLSRELLDSNGAAKQMAVRVLTDPQEVPVQAENLRLNQAISRTLSQGFDGTLGRSKVFLEYGGRHRLTQQGGIVTKFPVEDTRAVSVMSYGYYPELAKASAYHGGYYAVLQSVAKHIALTGSYDSIRLTMQEFFPSVKGDPERMGLPFAALLGAYEAMKQLDIPAVGGKDSMSGSFDELDVPPTLVSFAVSVSDLDTVVSRELKSTDSTVYLTRLSETEDGLVDPDRFATVMAAVQALYGEGHVRSASAVSEHGLRFTLDDMGIGNGIGWHMTDEDVEDRFYPGALLLELPADQEVDERYLQAVATTHDRANYRELVEERLHVLAPVYKDVTAKDRYSAVDARPYREVSLAPLALAGKQVLIPVLQGSTGEYDLQRAFEQAGFTVEQVVIKSSSAEAFDASVLALAKGIDAAQVFAVPHGEYFGGAIRGVAGVMAELLQLDPVKQALQRLRVRQGFILGFGAGFAALIEAGLFGDLEGLLSFRTNKHERYLHVAQDLRVVRNSYLTDASCPVYTAPLNGKHMTLVCEDLERLEEEVDILTVTAQNYLPGNCGVDTIASKDGHVIGMKTLVERMTDGLYRNVPLLGIPKHFEILSQYFE